MNGYLDDFEIFSKDRKKDAISKPFARPYKSENIHIFHPYKNTKDEISSYTWSSNT